jgi:predicted sugar kinase
MGKWFVRFVSETYATSLDWKHNVEMILIPKKIGKYVLSSASRTFLHGLVSFGDTFISLANDSYLAVCKARWIEKLKGKSPSQRAQYASQAARELETICLSRHLEMAGQSWIDFIQFFIPIPFLEVIV